MQYTESERQAWNTAADFFEPNGVLDEDACEKYYAAHLGRTMHAVHIEREKGELLFALMKKTVNTAQAMQTFVRVYNHTRSASPRLQLFLGHVAEHEPAVLGKWLKQASREAGITEQILLLRDVKQWLPHEDVGQYTNPAILNMKPSAFVKKFSPDISDMEHLLAVGLDFQSKPTYAHLGLLMVQGIFISLYGKEHDPQVKERTSIAASLEKKYSARAAFGLMQNAGVQIHPRDLMELIKVRYRAECLESDALAYVYESLNEGMVPEKRDYVLKVFNTILESHQKNPSMLYNDGLLYIYAALEKDAVHDNTAMLKRVEDALMQHVAQDPAPSRSIGKGLILTPGLISKWLDAIQSRAKDEQNQQLLHALYIGRQHQYPLYDGMGSRYSQHPEQIRQLSQARITPEQITQLFVNRFETILTLTNGNGSAASFLHKINQLEESMEAFFRQVWPQEKLQHLKNSTIVPKWVLAYSCMGACATSMSGQQLSVMPQLNQEPLAFLKKLYPEHTTVWNTMLKTMLMNEATDLNSYKQQKTQIFNILSRTFLPGKPSMEDVMSVSSAVGVTPLDYVIGSCENAHTLMLQDLDGAVFDLTT